MRVIAGSAAGTVELSGAAAESLKHTAESAVRIGNQTTTRDVP